MQVSYFAMSGRSGIRSILAIAGVALAICASASPPTESWVATWAAAPMALPAQPGQDTSNATWRDIVHISLGGSKLRVQLTNEFGATPLTIGAAHIAPSVGSGATDAGSDRALTFGGRGGVTIPAGAMVISDAVNLDAPRFADLAISVFLPEQPLSMGTCHVAAESTNYRVPGDATSAAQMPNAAPETHWCFVKGVDVLAPQGARAVVAFGDSITDGAHSTKDANRRWPDDLAQRLLVRKPAASIGVLNEGIGGNRLLHDVQGQNALARFDRDVLAASGAKYIVVLEGINDIGHGALDPSEAVSSQEIIFALAQLASRAREHGLKVYGATLLPYEGAHYYSEAGEKDRETVNDWIRTGGTFDAVIDFDKATRDPEHPTRLLPKYDSGDHLHPNDDGYKAMADAVPLSLF